ncbi:hypothetical protein AURDEDRAFT_176729 [Auricularia subglabra TFB-10046 SS5]|uniref:Uncharacterized protein n=1 Tax=Auricularia subglabra (strain TFB-10046 / SS5) TaxID=717982 RepID=J0WQN9_AURST|nr:hypothetical protein AURDEDRAFT_176729 [Auricularia subglabra TFB-10046 SS5]
MGCLPVVAAHFWTTEPSFCGAVAHDGNLRFFLSFSRIRPRDRGSRLLLHFANIDPSALPRYPYRLSGRRAVQSVPNLGSGISVLAQFISRSSRISLFAPLLFPKRNNVHHLTFCVSATAALVGSIHLLEPDTHRLLLTMSLPTKCYNSTAALGRQDAPSKLSAASGRAGLFSHWGARASASPPSPTVLARNTVWVPPRGAPRRSPPPLLYSYSFRARASPRRWIVLRGRRSHPGRSLIAGHPGRLTPSRTGCMRLPRPPGFLSSGLSDRRGIDQATQRPPTRPIALRRSTSLRGRESSLRAWGIAEVPLGVPHEAKSGELSNFSSPLLV